MKFIKLFIIVILMTSNMSVAQDFLLIHGWTGNGSQWNGSAFEQLIQNKILHTAIHKPTLGGTNSSYNQAMSLNTYLNNNNINNGIAIAYSMGGLNTRYYLKHEYGNQKISELYTIGSPLKGTYLANNRTKAVTLLLLGAASILYPGGYLEDGSIITVHGWNWDIMYVAGSLIFNPIADALINNYGGAATTDLEVGSEAVTYTNTGTSYENNIIKVGIAGTEIDPVLYRMGAHVIGATEESVLDVVDYIHGFKILQMINAFINYAENQTPYNLENLSHHLASYSFFKDINKNWKELILQASQSDGVVSKSSQEYPNANSQYYVNYASHLEQPYNINVLDALEDALTFYGHKEVQPIISSLTQSPEPICQGSYGYVYCNLSQGNGTLTYNWSASDLPAGAYITPMGNKCKVTYSYSSVAKDGGTNQIMAPVNQITCTVSNSAGSDNEARTVYFSTNCGGCPTLAFEENGVIENENPILTKSVISQEDVTDYYLIQKELNKADKEIKFIIHEPEEEHTFLDQIELLEVKVNPNEYVAVTENGEVISYKLSKKGIEFINGNKDDLENTLSSIDDNVTDFSSGDSLIINSESLSEVLNNDDMYLLFVGEKPPIKEQSVAELTTSGLDKSTESTQLFARPNKSVFGVKLGKKLSNTMKIKFHQDVEVDFISIVKNEKTAKVDKLKLVEAVHSESGKVIEQLSTVDEKYSEILPREKISFVFESKNNTDEKVSYILKSVGRYEESGSYKKGSESKTNETALVPTETKLIGNYPNPFNPTTQISYQLKEAAEVTIKIYDVLGKEVKTLVDGFKEEGYHQVSFDASSLSSGIYFYTMKTKEKYDIKKMLLVR